jgi:hypothetical protein
MTEFIPMKIGALDARNTADPPSLTMMELEGGSELSLGRWLTTPAVEADNHFHPLPGTLSARERGSVLLVGAQITTARVWL